MKHISISKITTVTFFALFIAGCSSSSDPIADNDTQQPDDPIVLPGGSLDLYAERYQLIEKLGGYALEPLSEEIALLGDMAATTALGSTTYEGEVYNVEDRGETISVPVVQVTYSCALGGQVIIQTTLLKIAESSYSRNLERNVYKFRDCQIAINGEHTLNGDLDLYADSTSASRASLGYKAYSFSTFSWAKADDSKLVIDASISTNSSESNDSSFTRLANINQFVSSSNDQIGERIYVGDFTLSTSSTLSGAVQQYSLNVDGQVTGQSLVPVSIVTEPEMTRTQVFGGISVESMPFSGEIRMDAEDGSRLLIEAVDPSDTTVLQVDITHTDSAGNQIVRRAQNFVDLPGSVL